MRANAAYPRPLYLRSRPRRLGDLTTELAAFSAEQIVSAYDWLKNTAREADQERIAQTQWLAANAVTLSDQGKKQYIAALQAKTAAVNELYAGLAKLQAVLPSSVLGSLGIAPLIVGGVILAILAAAGIGIYAIYAKIQSANAQMAQAQNMRVVSEAVADKIRTANPEDVPKILDAYRAANNPEETKPFPWNTLFISAAVAGIAYSVFG